MVADTILTPDPNDVHWQADGTLVVIVDGDDSSLDCIGGKQTVTVTATITDASGHHETRGLIRGVPTSLAQIVLVGDRFDIHTPHVLVWPDGDTAKTQGDGTYYLDVVGITPADVGRYALIVEVADD